MEKFAFLKSVRFWKVVIIVALEVSVKLNWIDGATAETITRGIEMILAASVTIRTVDKLGEPKEVNQLV